MQSKDELDGNCRVEGSEQRYLPFGQPRLAADAPTDFTYTGQRALAATGLMDYNARWYSTTLAHFISADTTVPDLGHPQSLNRYSYVLGNPMKLVDPTGKMPCYDAGSTCNFPSGKAISSPPPPPPLITIQLDPGREDDEDIEDEIAAIKKDATIFAAKLALAYNAYVDYLRGVYGYSIPMQKYDQYELWYILFNGPVNFHFTDGGCDGCFARRDQNPGMVGVVVGNNITVGYFQRKTGFAVHEIFHVLDITMNNYGFTNTLEGKDLGRSIGGWAGEFEEGYYSESLYYEEVIADMGAAWGSDLGFAENSYGILRQDHMDTYMGPLLFEMVYGWK